MKKIVRNKLEELSLKTYGIKGFYSKIRKSEGYQIPVGVKAVVESDTPYVVRNGTWYKESTAVEKFGFTPRERKVESKSKMVFRGPTDEELIFMMDRAYQDMVVSQVLSSPELPHHPTFMLAYLHKNDRLSWDLRLVHSLGTEEYNTAVDTLLAKVSKEDADKINGWIIKEGESTEGAVDLEEYLIEFTELNEESDNSYEMIFTAAEQRRNELLAKHLRRG